MLALSSPHCDMFALRTLRVSVTLSTLLVDQVNLLRNWKGTLFSPAILRRYRQAHKMSSFTDLIRAIGTALGPTSGLDSDEVNHNGLIALMEQYESNEADWSLYALGDSNRNYTRNLVDNTNGKSNILVVVWV